MATKVNLEQFQPQELYQLRQGFQAEINTLNQSLNQFRYAIDKFEEGKRAIKAADQLNQNQQLLVPLSNSLYIEGVMDNVRNGQRVYLIEYGAGFFVQRNAKQAIDFYLRKIQLVKQKSSKLAQIINEKREGLRAVQVRMMTLAQQAQGQGQAQGQKMQ